MTGLIQDMASGTWAAGAHGTKCGMTKYRVDRIDSVDRIITGAYTGPLAKRHCTAARANADVDGDNVTECTGRQIWTESRAVWQ